MLQKITNGTIIVKCNSCGLVNSNPLKTKKHVFIEEYGEYENYYSEPCTGCEGIEVFNLNIPVDEMAEFELEQDVFPYKEIDQRHYVRQLMKLTREDLQ